MSRERNKAIHRRQSAAFQSGDRATVLSLYSSDAVWHLPGSSILASDHREPDAVDKVLAKSVELTEGTFRLELLEAACRDVNIHQWNRITATRADVRSMNGNG
jgi:ketosteroid isomerase-like protein